MKKNQIYGIVSIGLGVLLLISLLFSAFVYQATFILADNAVKNYPYSFMILISYINYPYSVVVNILSWVSLLVLISSIVLVILGIVLLLNKNEKEKLYKSILVISILAGVMAIAAAVLAIPVADIIKPGVGVEPNHYTLKRTIFPGAGIFLLSLVGIVCITALFFIEKFIIRRKINEKV